MTKDEKAQNPLRPNWYISRPELWALDEACKPLRETFPSYGPYLVGSVIERPTYRDVDVRLILRDEEYDRLTDDEWGLLGFITSRHLAAVTRLPIDFQFQRHAEANAAYGHKTRTPLGLRGPGHWCGDGRPPAPTFPPACTCGSWDGGHPGDCPVVRVIPPGGESDD